MSDSARLVGLDHRDAQWAGLRVVVTGLGVSGFAAADALLERGARVTVLDSGSDAGIQAERAKVLDILGADVRIGGAHVQAWPTDLGDVDVVVTSPGWRPTQPVLGAAGRLGIPVWGEVELAWRMRTRHGAAAWLCVTGTNGKTTTVRLLESMLKAAGLRALAVGNVGTPVLEAVLHPEPYDVLAVELSSFQLHYAQSLSPLASCVLNVAPDHLDWHGSQAAYADAKARIYARTQVACVYNVQDRQTEQMVVDADVIEGCRAIGFTMSIPARSMVGLVDDVLADRAFVAQRADSAAELATLTDIAPDGVPAPHMVANTLAAAALARAAGVLPSAVREGVRTFVPDEHRITEVARIAGVTYVNDSKATNPHAAAASLRAYPHVVWVAGGQLKGADVEALVETAAPRLRGVVLLGADREQLAQALVRHAPQVRVEQVATPETEGMSLEQRADVLSALMDRVLGYAAQMAHLGDTVLLAPAAASLDMFPSYEARGHAFSEAVRRRADREEAT
ncbi:MAG: UDP-N-acetylmuramoyl-L-alanine--D-glutamate ligase [Ornithinimicrobium sp.]